MHVSEMKYYVLPLFRITCLKIKNIFFRSILQFLTQFFQNNPRARGALFLKGHRKKTIKNLDFHYYNSESL
jgi:hypothetical protein